MLPIAFATQRAPPPRGTYAKQTQQETSWPKRLKAKASARTLKSKSSLASLTRRGTSQSSTGSQSPLSPAQPSPILGETPPPVPAIPLRFVTGSPESSSEASPSGTPIAPFLAFEKLAPTKKTPTTPTTPKSFRRMRSASALGSTTTLPPTTPTSSSKLRSARAVGSTTTVNSTVTTPSFPSIPEDPVWDEAVARVRERVRLEQEEERREQKASSKAERRVIRNVSKGREGHLKWAKLAIEGIIGKYDEHGWLPKKDPKDFDDDDWKFVLEVLNHEDTKKLRDRLFKKPEWIEADKARRLRYEEAMRINPTPEYLAAQKAQKAKERKEYGFRKILGMLTEEELELERLGESPQVGLGISNVLEPATPSTVHTTKSSKATGQSSQSSGRHQSASRGRNERLGESPHVALGISNVLEPATPSTVHTTKSSKATGQSSQSSGTHQTAIRGRKRADQVTTGSASLARRSVEQMTGVFNIDGFDPRLSRLGSEEIKQYIREKSATRSEPQTPTPVRFHGNASLDPRQSTQDPSTQGSSPEIASAQTVQRTKNRNVLSKSRPPANARALPFGHFSPPTPTAVHPALRESKIPRLRHVKSSITPSSGQSERDMGETRLPMPIAPSRTQPKLPRDRPPQPSKPSSAIKVPSAIKASSEPASFRSFTSQVLPPPFSLNQGKPLSKTPKTAPLIRKPSTAVKTTRSTSASANPAGQVQQQVSPSAITFNNELTQSRQTDSLQSNAARNIGSEFTDLHNSEWQRTIPRHAVNDNFESAKDILDTSKCLDQRRTSSLPLFEPTPKSFARLSRVPTFPDASDFLAAMGEDIGEDMPHDTSSSSLAPLTPRDRSTANRGNIPVAIESSQPTNYPTGFNNYPTVSPTVSLPIIRIGTAREDTATQASASYVKSAATGKWEIVPPAAQQETLNETSLPTEEAAFYRIEHVEDLTQLSPVTTRPTEQSQQGPNHTPTATPPDNSMRPESSDLNVSFAEVINAWQQASPVPATQGHDTFSNQEIQILRSEIGLEPIHEHIPGNAKHPNHHYTWNTKKIMCRRIHNPGIVLPSLPSPTPGLPANMAEYANEFFVGSPYTNEPSDPECCAACGSLCCRFAELHNAPQKRTTDIVELNKIRRNAAAVATLRATKPNGVEEWDAFLVCSQCQRAFCPDCITLCSEELCQEPVCSGCRDSEEGLELCRLHNMI